MHKGDIIYGNMGRMVPASHTQKGWRPAVVLDVFQNNCTVIPFTSQAKKKMPTHVKITAHEVPTIKGENTILCENCTIIPLAETNPAPISYNIRVENPDVWAKIVNGLSIQLSRKYDYCERYVTNEHRRGAVLHIKSIAFPVIILSNEKNNEYSDNLTVAPLFHGLPLSRTGYDIQDKCFLMSNVAIANVAHQDITKYVGYAGKKIANHITKQYIQLLSN